METADLEIRSSGGVVPNDWGVINVMCGVDTVIAQQIQLLHSMNREGRQAPPTVLGDEPESERTACP